ncbi:MAG: hypothetical protein KZQ56_10180 [gamma proteobacterium symbiont of Lucinoma myriamae]|nr:hypothetical protein [gamma proteobacterium symbiont of Lucinoma myriamae]
MERGKPKVSGDDQLVLQTLVARGMKLSDLHNHPELGNVIANTKSANFLFGEEIAEQATESAFKFNLAGDYQKYQTELEVKELIADYSTELCEYMNTPSELADSAIAEEEAKVHSTVGQT